MDIFILIAFFAVAIGGIYLVARNRRNPANPNVPLEPYKPEKPFNPIDKR